MAQAQAMQPIGSLLRLGFSVSSGPVAELAAADLPGRGRRGPAVPAQQLLVQQLLLSVPDRPVVPAVLGEGDEHVLAAHPGLGQVLRDPRKKSRLRLRAAPAHQGDLNEHHAGYQQRYL